MRESYNRIMESDNKPNSFAADLKAYNISENAISLDENAKQIGLLLNQIETGDSKLAVDNVESIKNAVAESQNASPKNRVNEYVKLGEHMQFLVMELNHTENKKYLKQMAVCYLDIAKLSEDERVKNLSFAVADRLIGDEVGELAQGRDAGAGVSRAACP